MHTDMIWLGGCAFTVFLAVLSITAVRWWPLAYIFAVVFGAAAGVLLWDFPDWARHTWWLGWMIYSVSLPIGKTAAERRRMRRG